MGLWWHGLPSYLCHKRIQFLCPTQVYVEVYERSSKGFAVDMNPNFTRSWKTPPFAFKSLFI